MPRPTLLFGDTLHVLEPFAASPTVVDCRVERPVSLTTSARALVLAVDLRDVSTSFRARRRLKAALADADSEARRYGQFAHFIVVYMASKAEDTRLHSAASGLAVRVHASLERELGESVDVVLLDATTCDEPGLLGRRLNAHIQRPAGTASDSALSWRTLQRSSIAAACTGAYC